MTLATRAPPKIRPTLSAPLILLFSVAGRLFLRAKTDSGRDAHWARGPSPRPLAPAVEFGGHVRSTAPGLVPARSPVTHRKTATEATAFCERRRRTLW